MNKKILSVLMSLLCSNVVMAAEQKRIITIDEIAQEVGILFLDAKVPPSERGIGELIPMLEVRTGPSGNASQGEVALLFARGVVNIFTSKRFLRRVLTPEGVLTPQAQKELDAQIKMLGQQPLPKEFASSGGSLPLLLESILDIAHNMLGVFDERVMPALRKYLAELLYLIQPVDQSG